MAFDGATENLTVEMTLDTKKLLNQLSQLKNNITAQINAMQKSLNNINLNALAKSTKAVQNSFNAALTAVAQLQAKIKGIKTNITIKTQTEQSSNSSSGTADILKTLAMGQAVGRQVGQSIGKEITNSFKVGANVVKESAKAYKKAEKKAYREFRTQYQQNSDGMMTSPSKNGYRKASPELYVHYMQAIDKLKNLGMSQPFKNIYPSKGQVATFTQSIKNSISSIMASIKEGLRNSVLNIGGRNRITGQTPSNQRYLAEQQRSNEGVTTPLFRDLPRAQQFTNSLKIAGIYAKMLGRTVLFNTVNLRGVIAFRKAIDAVKVRYYDFLNGLNPSEGITTFSAFGKLGTVFNKLKPTLAKLKQSFKELYDKTTKASGSSNNLADSMNRVGNGAKKAKTGVSGFVSTLKKLLPFISIYAIFRGIKQATQNAIDAIEDTSLIGTIFKDNTAAVQEWSESIEGVYALDLQKSAATIYNIGTNMGIAGDKALKMSEDMAMLSQDMASFYNITQEDAFTKLKSGLVGETEPLRNLGIMVDTNTLKQYGYSSSLSNSEKVMIRYNAIMAQTAAAQGDMARTIDNPAGRIRVFTANLKSMMVALGKCFVPIVTVVVPILNTFVKIITGALQALSNFLYVLFGIKITTGSGGGAGIGDTGTSIGDVGSDIGGIGDAADDSTGKVKKLKGELMGFDEIHKLNIDDTVDSGSGSGSGGGSGSGSGGGGYVSPSVQISDEGSEIEKHASALAEKIRGYFSNISFQPLIDSFNRLKEACKPIIDDIGKGLDWFIKNIIAPLTKWTVEEALPAFFDLLAAALDALDPILQSVGGALEDLWDEFLAPIAGWTADKFVDFLKWLTQKLEKFAKWAKENPDDLDKITKAILSIVGALTIVSKLKLGTGLATVAGLLGGPVTVGLLCVGGLLLNWDKLTEGVKKQWKGFTDWLDGIGPWWSGFFDKCGEKVKKFKDDTIQSGKEAREGLKRQWGGFTDSMKKVGDGLTEARDNFNEFCDGIGEKVDGAGEKLNGFLGDIGSDVAQTWEEIKGVGAELRDGFNDTCDQLGEFVDGLGDDIDENLRAAAESTGQYFVDMKNDVGDALVELRDDFNDTCDKLGKFIDGLGEDIDKNFRAAAESTGQYFVDMKNDVGDALVELRDDFNDTCDKIGDFVDNAGKKVNDILAKVGQDVWDELCDIGDDFVQTGVEIKNVGVDLRDKFNSFADKLGEKVDKLGTDINNTLRKVPGFFKEKFDNAAQKVKDAFANIPSFFSGLGDKIRDKFANIGSRVGSAISGAVRSAVNTVLSTAVSKINWFIGMINGAINIINKIPGVNIGHVGYLYVPQLAKGGIVKRSTLANIGEAGAEAVIPLENNTGWIRTLAHDIVDELGANEYNSNNKNSDKSLEVNMRVGTSEFGRIIINSLSAWEKQQGKSVLDVL